MRVLNVALLEWPDGLQAGGPRLLGRTSDPELVTKVQELLAAERRRELARLESPVRLVPNESPAPSSPPEEDEEGR